MYFKKGVPDRKIFHMREQPDCVRSFSQMSRWGIGLAVNTGTIQPSKTGRQRFSFHVGKFKYCFASGQKFSWCGREREQAFTDCECVDVGWEQRTRSGGFSLFWVSCSFGLCVSVGGYCLSQSQSEQSNSFTSLTCPFPWDSSCIRDRSHRPPFWELFLLGREYSPRTGPTSIMAHFYISRDHQNVQKLHDL